MAKFLNKKEQVFDIKLTSYGNHMLSIGKFKPTYYEFFDDNILYDGRYAMYTGSNAPEKSDSGITLRENQNLVHKRIKEETQYLETLYNFEEVENNIAQLSGDTYDADVSPIQTSPRIDIFKANQGIGDAFLQGNTQHMPAWKLVCLDGEIKSSSPINLNNEISRIPQVNISLNYKKQVSNKENTNIINANPQSVAEFIDTTRPFADNYRIEFVTDHGLFYLEEANTTLLTKNYEIEVFDRTVAPPTHPSASITLNSQPAENDYVIVVTSYENFRSAQWYKYQFKNSDTSESGGTRYVTLGSATADKTAVQVTAEALFNKIELSLAGELGGTAGKDQSFHNVTYDGDATISLTLNNVGSIYNFELQDYGAAKIISEATDGTITVDGWFGGTDIKETLEKKYFENTPEQIVDGMMMSATPVEKIYDKANLTTSSVEYYFDILSDNVINEEFACKGADVFNKESLYVSLDFDCDSLKEKQDIMYNDIYGPVTEPEICQD
tara:strand:+ start:1077 stop:2567 length:1491 start_codon:yes stop_codon:yes gene_type:complete